MEARLTTEEIRHLVLTLMDAIDAIEGDAGPRSSITDELLTWCEVLVDRLYEGE